jgi:hypothetical protein
MRTKKSEILVETSPGKTTNIPRTVRKLARELPVEQDILEEVYGRCEHSLSGVNLIRVRCGKPLKSPSEAVD